MLPALSERHGVEPAERPVGGDGIHFGRTRFGSIASSATQPVTDGCQSDAAIALTHRKITLPGHLERPPLNTTRSHPMATYNLLKIQQQKLAEQQAELERQIAAMQAQEKASALQKIKALMAELGITLADLELMKKQPRTKAPAFKFKVTSGVSYRDPASGVLWSGRGRRPAWVIRWVTEGRDLAALTVPAA